MKTEYFEWDVAVVGLELLLFLENSLLASCWAPLLLQAVWGFVIIHPPQSSSPTGSQDSCFFMLAVWILRVDLTLESGFANFWISSIFLTCPTATLLLYREDSDFSFFIICFSYSTNGMSLGWLSYRLCWFICWILLGCAFCSWFI